MKKPASVHCTWSTLGYYESEAAALAAYFNIKKKTGGLLIRATDKSGSVVAFQQGPLPPKLTVKTAPRVRVKTAVAMIEPPKL